MILELCGKCLHNKLAHEKHNGHFMYCGSCFAICELQEFNQVHKPTDIETIMRIGASKQ